MSNFKVLTKLWCNLFANTLFGLQQVAVEIDEAKMNAINKTPPVKNRPIFQFNFYSVTQQKQTL